MNIHYCLPTEDKTRLTEDLKRLAGDEGRGMGEGKRLEGGDMKRMGGEDMKRMGGEDMLKRNLDEKSRTFNLGKKNLVVQLLLLQSSPI